MNCCIKQKVEKNAIAINLPVTIIQYLDIKFES